MRQHKITFTMKIVVFLIQTNIIIGISGALAQTSYSTSVPDETIERLREIYQEGAFSPKVFRATWLPDGSGYLVLENTPENNEQRNNKYSLATI